VRDDELGFDGVPVDVFPDRQRPPRSDVRSDWTWRPGPAQDAADALLTEVIRAHRVILDIHQGISARFSAQAHATGRAPAAHRPDPVRTVVASDAEPGEYRVGAVLTADCPLPPGPGGTVALMSAWQEIAGWAAGLLAVRCGVATEFPDGSYAERTVENRLRLLRDTDPGGRTARVTVRLLGHFPLHRAVMLRCGIGIALDGEPCCEGEIVQGFFAPAIFAEDIAVQIHEGPLP
jgi:hypothetical protein